ncbi:MBL fold metallo-hydrolase [Spongiimicrobium salis]|uniref:MBL fold metallo-hydrolase n=1 Tax=Spongiimicrobium salis TaxID=1667022 RepID=UPI00374CC654
MKLKRLHLGFLSIFIVFLSCAGISKKDDTDWCGQPLRPQFKGLKEISVSSHWFKVYEVGHNTYAIAEPFNFQEVISYLIIGKEMALLFDSGMGMASMAATVQELTQLPITVLNSHTHYDHIGGNYEFNTILAMNTSFTKARAQHGLPHSFVQHEVRKNALCLDKIKGLDTLNYHIKGFSITRFITDKTVIDLGNRKLEVLATPGHTPDAISVLDEENGYLWTGDTFYEAPIWLFDEETDLKEYQKSIQKLSALHPKLNKVFPAHNTPVAEPIRLQELVAAFDEVLRGVVRPTEEAEDSFVFNFPYFSFVIRKELLSLD